MGETYPSQDTRQTERKRTSQTPPPRAERAAGGRSVGTLLKDLSQEVSTLVRKEGALARAELREKLSQAGSGAAELGAGALVTFAGLLFLLQSATWALRFAVGSMWLSALLVGGATFLIGLILLARARSNLRAENLAPERTTGSIGRDVELARSTGERAGSQAEFAHETTREGR